MTDIKEYLPYCVGKTASICHKEKGITGTTVLNWYNVSFFINDTYTIIPHMRKIESLTEEEQKKIYRLRYRSDAKSVLKQDIIETGLLILVDGYGIVRTISLNSLSPAQFHYLTSIGIAWWATDEMWDTGAIIEVKQ